MKALVKGDYVLATKYRDGDPQDHWCVGYFKETYDHFGQQRHIIVDKEGAPFRANGFRRAKKISTERGNWIVKNMKKIEMSSFSVWHYARCKMS